MMKQVHVYISGFVQGVGFRHFVKSNARKLGLTGWVCNTPVSPDASQGGPDNRVEAVLQGSDSTIKEMIKLCKKGPFLSEVEDIQVEWEEMKEPFVSFEIVA